MKKSPGEAALQKLKEKKLKLSVAESVTGGLLSHMITNVYGSSGQFKGGVVAYTDEIKKEILGIKTSTLKKYGAVSLKTAEEMAASIRKKFKSDIGVATTGIAGPAGATKKNPVGTVYIAVCDGKKVSVKKLLLKGEREMIKKKAAISALSAVLGLIS